MAKVVRWIMDLMVRWLDSPASGISLGQMLDSSRLQEVWDGVREQRKIEVLNGRHGRDFLGTAMPAGSN
jgi:hypothetical protein